MLPSPARARKQSSLLSKTKNLRHLSQVFRFTRAGPRGLEPRPLVLETRILPLNYRPVLLFYFITLVDLTYVRILLSSERGSRKSLLLHDRVSADSKKRRFLTLKCSERNGSLLTFLSGMQRARNVSFLPLNYRPVSIPCYSR